MISWWRSPGCRIGPALEHHCAAPFFRRRSPDRPRPSIGPPKASTFHGHVDHPVSTAAFTSLETAQATAPPDDRRCGLHSGVTERSGLRVPRWQRLTSRGTRWSLWPCAASATRDERHVENPKAFEINRKKTNRSFGGGFHVCPGPPLSRIEGVAAFQALVRRVDRFE